MDAVARHYDALIDEGNDPVYDPEPLRAYMDQWDGQLLIDALSIDSQATVFELGIGTGRLAVRVAPLCKQLCGIDLSPKTVERAKENLKSFSNVRVICSDFMEYQPSECFDAVYSSLTFFHIQDKKKAINKVYAMLHMGGRFVLSIDKSPNTCIDMGNRTVRLFSDDPLHIEHCLQNAGFAAIKRYELAFAYLFVAEK